VATRREIVSTIENAIQNRLNQAGLIFNVAGREKTFPVFITK
jgi:hypothetical protein